MRKEKIILKKIKNFLEKTKEKIIMILVSIYTVSMISTPVYAAEGVTNSQIVKGTEKLINDTTTWLMVLAPVLAGLLIIYFCIRRSAADEMDQKKWNNRIVVAIVSCIGAVLGSATLNLIVGYYK